MKNQMVTTTASQRALSTDISKKKIKQIRNDLADTRVKTQDIMPVVMAMSDSEIADLRKSFDARQPKVSELPPEENAKALRQISAFLDLVTMRVVPNMQDNKLERYCNAMLVVMETLPWKPLAAAMESLKAAPFRFIQDIEKQIREKVREFSSGDYHDGRLGFTRFLELKDKREQAALPKPQPRDLSIEEIAKINTDLVRMGIKLGAITEEQAAEAKNIKLNSTVEVENDRLKAGLSETLSNIPKE